MLVHRILVVFLFTVLGICAAAQTKGSPPVADTASLQAAIDSFIQAFDNLDWEKFRQAFADDATVFYPRRYPHCASGREQYEATFREVFEGIRKGKTSPPYMDIKPRDFQLQVFGDAAVATFHLDDRPGWVNRRTLVLHKTDTGWKIVHLHASEVATPEEGSLH